jgi:Uma2 family endonuclease
LSGNLSTLLLYDGLIRGEAEVMATVTQPVSLEEFRSRYRLQKPHFEYWFGVPIQKPMPSRLHGVLQGIICEALRRAGYRSGSEAELRIDPQWEPVPDVMATLKPVKDYPTEPVEIVAEILSPDDKLVDVISKCRHYQRIGSDRIFVLDPVERLAWQWNSGSLEAISQLSLPNGAAAALDEIWRQLDEQA